MSYAYTHLKPKTIIDIKIFMHSNNELYNYLYLLGSPIGVTELITRTHYRAYTSTTYLILTQNLHLQQAYPYLP